MGISAESYNWLWSTTTNSAKEPRGTKEQTGSPTLKLETLGPTESTKPEKSEPGMKGRGGFSW